MGAAPGRYQMNASQENEILCRMLDRGIDDMEERRELPVEEAFKKITELRNMRRKLFF